MLTAYVNNELNIKLSNDLFIQQLKNYLGTLKLGGMTNDWKNSLKEFFLKDKGMARILPEQTDDFIEALINRLSQEEMKLLLSSFIGSLYKEIHEAPKNLEFLLPSLEEFFDEELLYYSNYQVLEKLP